MTKKIIIPIIVASIATFIAMTQYFAHSVRSTPNIEFQNNTPPPHKTGIVVATGLDGRIATGVRLLAENHATRLLISGAGEGVRQSDIKMISALSQTIPLDRLDNVMRCCVDLGFDATNTVLNATEAKIWANAHDFDYIIVVTSDFHMPRTIIAFSHHFPKDKLIPYRAKTPWLQLNEKGISGWWRSPQRISIIASEMVKYAISRAASRAVSRADRNL